MECLNMRIQTHPVAQLNCKAFPKRGFFVNRRPMEGGDKSKKPAETTEMENLTLDISTSTGRFSRDLLQRFMGSSSIEMASTKHVETLREEEQEDEDIELNLGLSLGGNFGVDKISTNLMRSSSIASCLPIVRDVNDSAVPPPPPPVASNPSGSLTRTSSLPLETEEEWRKRKELQCLRRMEAKRRRSEKQKNMMRTESAFSRVQSLSADEKRGIELNLRERLDREKAVIGIKRSSSSQFGSSLNRVVSLGNVRGGVDLVSMEKGKGSSSRFSSQGSIESKGGSSSSDFETKSLQGSSGDLSPATIQSLQEGTNQRPEREDPCKRRDTSSSSGDNMPCVFTKGDGPHGKRVDGILYKYGKGEQVKIVCVCHGTFHSPSEFIRHAGGTDVDNPLKHIVMNPNSSGMLM